MCIIPTDNPYIASQQAEPMSTRPLSAYEIKIYSYFYGYENVSSSFQRCLNTQALRSGNDINVSVQQESLTNQEQFTDSENIPCRSLHDVIRA